VLASQVTLTKGSANNRIGLTLDGDKGPPRVQSTEPASLAALSGRIHPDQLVLSINGQPVDGHEQATAIIKQSVGEVKFVLSNDNPFLA
jgi:C-terminal processing protease CtpA/Prc